MTKYNKSHGCPIELNPDYTDRANAPMSHICTSVFKSNANKVYDLLRDIDEDELSEIFDNFIEENEINNYLDFLFIYKINKVSESLKIDSRFKNIIQFVNLVSKNSGRPKYRTLFNIIEKFQSDGLKKDILNELNDNGITTCEDFTHKYKIYNNGNLIIYTSNHGYDLTLLNLVCIITGKSKKNFEVDDFKYLFEYLGLPQISNNEDFDKLMLTLLSKNKNTLNNKRNTEDEVNSVKKKAYLIFSKSFSVKNK